MTKLFNLFLILSKLFLLITSAELSIRRTTRIFPEKHDNLKLTPFLVSLTSEDVFEKKKYVDLVCIIDVSGSMRGDKMNLVKESLISFVNLMTKDDKLALVPFASSASSNRFNLAEMTPQNKQAAINYINKLVASGGTNIYSGLSAGLNQLTNDYRSGERIASMILLSDGEDGVGNVETKFRRDLESKKDYIFTLHSFGYGNEHDAELMNSLSKIRYGGYFFIRQLDMVQEALVEIYGSLSTVNDINVDLTIQSNFEVKYYNGIEDDFKPVNNIFNIKIYHFVFGKHYNYAILLDVPENTPDGTVILTAKASAKLFNISTNFEWENIDDNQAFEAYIKYIFVTDLDNSYLKAKKSKVSEGINIINNGKQWLNLNYNGKEEWDKVYDTVLNDLNYFSTYGKPSLLSKIRELKYLQLGLNYHDENSYQRKLIDDSYEADIDTDDQNCTNITKDTSIEVEDGIKYYYFTLVKGIGEIEGMHFSEENNVILIYTENKTALNIKPLSSDFEICFIPEKTEKRKKPKYEVNPFKGIKFSFEKDFPFEFYTRVDGTKDITFNVQFFTLETKDIPDSTDSTDSTDSDQPIVEEITHDFVIKAYVLNDNSLDKPTGTELTGFYDRMHRVGKFVIKQEEISKYLSLNYKNYLYIIIQKNTEYNIEYTKVEGQLSFVSMDYVFADIPEGFYIFSNLPQNEKNPHKYRFKLDPEKGKTTRIEFISSANELDCSVIKYSNGYIPGSEDYYKDINDTTNLDINRLGNKMGKQYIDIITNKDKEINDYKYLVLSIFSTNGGHITGSEIEKLSYAIRYTTSSNYGIYSFKDSNDGEGESYVEDIMEDNTKKKVIFHSLKSALEPDTTYTEEKTRFFIKLYKIIKQRQKLYRSIALFEYSYPIYTLEKEVDNNEDAYFILNDLDPDTNYFYTLFTVSNKNNEILSYESKKIFKNITNFDIEDDKSYQYELDKEQDINITMPETTDHTYLMIKISDFEDGKYGTLEAYVENQYYKSVQPSKTNYILIAATEDIFEKQVNIKIKLKDHQSTGYFLTVKLTDSLELYVGEKASIEINDESLKDLDVTLSESGGIKNNVKLVVQSIKGNFEVNNLGISLSKSDKFGAQFGLIDTVDSKGISFQINSKLGDFVTISSYMINNNKQKKIEQYEINRYGYLGEEDCISLSEDMNNIEKYQVRILGDKSFNIKYNSKTDFDILEPGILYMKSFTKYIEQICVFRTDKIMESAFYNLQIIDTSKQQITTDILLPAVMENIYSDILDKNEVRYYTQGTFDPEPSNDLEYLYKVKQIKGEIKVYKAQCENFPYCQYSKEFLEESKANEIYNIDEYFIYSQKAIDFDKYNSQNIPVFIILCLSDSCEYNFMIEKSNSLIDLSKLEKYSSKIKKNNIQKFSVTPSENYEIISIDLYTHSGELDLNTNENCQEIKYTIFGNLETIEIPKTCAIKNKIDIYVQANMDSVYTIESKNIEDKTKSKIKTNIVHMEYIDKEKNIEYTPIKNSYNIKFIPINCEINVKYEVNGVKKNVPYLQNIYYYNSDSESEKIYEFNITTENTECMIYTYIEELTENYYSILSDQIPYYLSLKNNQTYKLLYPIPNANYAPMFKINFFEETPIKILYSINGIYADEDGIDTLYTKNIVPSDEFLKNCKNDEICYLTLEIIYDKKHENPILLEILPKSNNEIPALLFDNIMKQDFIKLNGEQQYMTKILKDEEGEVSFNYKHFSGELIANLINIDKHSWKNRYYLPEQNEQLIYDKLKQKIIFTKKETNKCTNGCYLLIEVHTFDNFNKNKNEMNFSMDYSIYLKKNDKIVNMKLNEYITGTLLKTLDKDNYIEYYSIQIPYSTKKIYIDYSSENTVVLINDDNTNPTKEGYKYKIDSNGQEQVFELLYEEDLKDKIFILGIYTTKLENGISQYNIRIRAENVLYENYIYSNSNSDNICEIKNNNQNCYFIIPITQIQKESDLLLYASSIDNSDDLIIYYKKINLITEKDDDKYTHTSEGQFIKNMLLINKNDLPDKENESILVKVEVKIKTTVNLLYTYNTGLNENLLSPNNKILYIMNPNEELYLTIPNSVRSLIHFDAINGKGEIGYENDEKSMIPISGKHSSIVLQSTENNQNKRIKISTSNSNAFCFYAYIKLDSQKRNMNEINNGNAIINSGQGFPIEFYSKITLIDDYIINFNINNLKPNTNPKIEKVSTYTLNAYIIPEETIEQLKDDETYVYYDIPFVGKYEQGFGIAKLELSKEDISKYYNKDKNNYIYLIIQSSNSNPIILKDIEGQVTILPKNNINYPLPEETYINSRLEHRISKNEYKLIKKTPEDKKMRIEFSANSFDIIYNITYDNKEKVDYTEKASLGKTIIDVNLLDKYDYINFEIIYDGNILNTTDDISYTLRYRTDEGNIIFKNYTQDEDVVIDEIKEESNITINYKKINITIPAIKEADTGKNIEGNYYLKIYKRINDSDYINGTICVIDDLEPYKVYEFKIEKENYTKMLEIPNDKNDYYIIISAVTNDKELLSYKKPILIEYKEEEEDTSDIEDTTDIHDDSSDNTDIYDNSTDGQDSSDIHDDSSDSQDSSDIHGDSSDEIDTTDIHDDSSDEIDTTDIHDDTSDYRKTDAPCEDCSSYVEQKDSLLIVVIVLSVICLFLILVIVYLKCKPQRTKSIEIEAPQTGDELPLLQTKIVDN